MTGSLRGNDADYSAVAFSSDGRSVAAGNTDGEVRLWDVSTHKQIGAPLIGGNSQVATLAFSPDSQTLGVLGQDGTVRLWDTATRQRIDSAFSGSDGKILAVSFSSDGKTLVAGTADGTVQQWNIGYLVDPLNQLCLQAGASVSPAEWARNVPPGPAYRNVCP
jgi:WD40 repeat protein